MKRTDLRAVAILLMMSTVAACGRDGNGTTDDTNTQLLARLDALEERLATVERRPGAPTPRRRLDPAVVYSVPVYPDDMAIGARDAKVTIVEAFEFACPYCATIRAPLEEVVARRPADVRLVLKHFVVHPDTATIPALALCAAARQGKGVELAHEVWAAAWPAVDGRPRFDRTQLAADKMNALATRLGLDLRRLADDQNGACRQQLDRDRRDLTRVGATGTPTVFINGRPYVGPRTVEGFEAAIAEEIKKADAAIAAGTPRAEYYTTIVKNGRQTP